MIEDAIDNWLGESSVNAAATLIIDLGMVLVASQVTLYSLEQLVCTMLLKFHSYCGYHSRNCRVDVAALANPICAAQRTRRLREMEDFGDGSDMVGERRSDVDKF